MNPPTVAPDADRPKSDAEKAMSANARSRDRQGKAADRARQDFPGQPDPNQSAAPPKPASPR